jgi:C4-dicarboxylate transporter, DctM subunit
VDPTTLAILGIVGMFLLILVHVPIGVAMMIAGVVGFGVLSTFAGALSLLASEASSVLSSADLAVIPLFLLMGNFATVAGLSADMYSLSYSLIGHWRGGLALSTIAGCGFFGAICGSSPATAVTFGRVALPEMLARKYSPELATGCVAAGGTLGSIVPPSVILIIYGVMAEELIITLFIAAIIPAIISILLYLSVVAVYVRIKPNAGPAGPRVGWADRFRTLAHSGWAIFMVLAVVGGIYGGVFTVNEAAALGAFLAFLLALGRRRLTKGNFWEAVVGTAGASGMIYTIIIGANVISYFVTLTHMPDVLIATISKANLPGPLVIFVLIVLYLIGGSIFDTVGAMLITLPFVLPLVVSYGYSPIWWGVMNVIFVEIGMITPPIGMNVFVIKGIVKESIPLHVIFRGVYPFLISDSVRLTILCSFPSFCLWLPSILR